MSLKHDLICSICKLILNNPVSLPCFCVVCHDHSTNSSWITCQTCNKEFEIPAEGLVPNKFVKNMLEKEVHLSDEEKTLKNSVEELIRQLERLHIDFETTQRSFEVFSDDHFSEIRRQIDLQRETLKEKIDEIALKMIDQTKANEELYKMIVRRKLAKISSTDIADAEKVLNEFRKPKALVVTVNKLKTHLEFKINR